MHKKLIILLCVLMLSGCAFLVAKETVKVIDVVLEDNPNPTKVKDPIKCDE